jgi:hypothetical protein
MEGAIEQEEITQFHNVSMFSMSHPILLRDVRTSEAMQNASGIKNEINCFDTYSLPLSD